MTVRDLTTVRMCRVRCWMDGVRGETVLGVAGAGPGDEGEYTCTVENTAGRETITITLYITEKGKRRRLPPSPHHTSQKTVK